VRFYLLHFLTLLLPAPPRTSDDSEDDDDIDAEAAEDMNAQDEEDVDAHNNEVNCGPSEPTEGSDNEGDDTSEEIHTNEHQTGDELAPLETGADCGTF